MQKSYYSGYCERVMLEKLLEIDWSKLEMAYGSAESVPALIHALMSPHPADWSAALLDLNATILHQGSIYTATVASVPFFLELLASDDVHCRGHLLSFLSGTIGGGYIGLATEEEYKNRPWLNAVQDDTEWRSEHKKLQRACAVQIYPEWERLLAMLHTPSLPIRITIPLLLSTLAVRAADYAPAALSDRDLVEECFEQMRPRLEKESHLLVRASLLFGLAQIASQCPPVFPLLRARLDEAYSPQERLAAAWNLVQQGQELPENAIDFLAETLREHAQTDHLFEPDFPGIEWRYHPIQRAVWSVGIHEERVGEESDDLTDLDADEDVNFPWADGWPRFNTIVCLCRQKYERLPALEGALLEALKSESPHTTECISHPILQFLFQCPRLSQEMETLVLSPVQEKALTILYDNPHLWTTNIMQTAFDDFGLPLKRQKWSRLLEREDAPYSSEDAFALLETLVREDNHLPANAVLRAMDWQAVRWLTIRTLCSDALIPFLERFVNLEALDISHSHVTDAGLQMLSALPKLRSLNLINLPITDAGLEFLGRLDSLEEVILSGKALSATGLNRLATLPELKTVRLFNTSVNALDAANFQLKSPQCKVELIERDP
jgi:hypothetical protein